MSYDEALVTVSRRNNKLWLLKCTYLLRNYSLSCEAVKSTTIEFGFENQTQTFVADSCSAKKRNLLSWDGSRITNVTIDLANLEMTVPTTTFNVMPAGTKLKVDYAIYTDRNFYLVGRLNTTVN